MKHLPFSLFAAFLVLPVICDAASLEVTAVNPLNAARASQTLELSAADLAPLGGADFSKVHVKDASGAELVCQVIDNDGDALRKPDAVIFQADFAAGETKRFTVTVGAKQVYKKEQFRAFGRFNRERFDDFVWENDKIAHRTYGKALETWKGEPLTSSTIDIWSKRTPRMVVNDWYLTDDYHTDYGDGADFYSAGPSRGCGGSGLWAADKLWVSKNFVNSKVLASGPIRVLFELEYAPYDVNGVNVGEVKRVSLDAGHYFDKFESRYKAEQSGSLSTAIGLKKVRGEKVESDPGNAWLAKWEPMEKKAGNQGLAAIVLPDNSGKIAEDALNHLVVTKPLTNQTATWWAGFCWDKAGEITSAEAWKKHVVEYAQGLTAPIKVTVATGK
jgi:pectinesterase